MRLLILAPAALLSGASVAAPPVVEAAPDVQVVGDMPVLNPNGPSRDECPPTSRYQAAQRSKAPQAQKLNELPAADMYKAVYRRIGECEIPIIASYGLGRP
jgi:hypothetical protein